MNRYRGLQPFLFSSPSLPNVGCKEMNGSKCSEYAQAYGQISLRFRIRIIREGSWSIHTLGELNRQSNIEGNVSLGAPTARARGQHRLGI